MNRLSILAAVIVTTLSALPGAFADEFWRKGLVEDEIRRHVIKECDLYTHYKMNMFEFPPLEVDSILYESSQAALQGTSCTREANLLGSRGQSFIL